MSIKCIPDEKQYVIKLNPNSLYEYTHHEIQCYGFEYFYLRFTAHPKDTHMSAKNITNYPNELAEYYKRLEASLKNPLVSHCQRSIDPLIWSESVFRGIPELWKKTRAHGLNYGWSQAVHDTQGRTSILSMARSKPIITKDEFHEKAAMCCGCAINYIALCSPSFHPNKSLTLFLSLCPCVRQRC